ncbi:zinc finger protein 37-like isoform X5, partial [Leptotrombidium deliense]
MNVAYHILREHRNEKRFECKVCFRKFFQQSTLFNHMVTYTNLNKYFCSVCDRRFNQRGNLTSHMKRFQNRKHPIQNESQKKRVSKEKKQHNITIDAAVFNFPSDYFLQSTDARTHERNDKSSRELSDVPSSCKHFERSKFDVVKTIFESAFEKIKQINDAKDFQQFKHYDITNVEKQIQKKQEIKIHIDTETVKLPCDHSAKSTKGQTPFSPKLADVEPSYKNVGTNESDIRQILVESEYEKETNAKNQFNNQDSVNVQGVENEETVTENELECKECSQ